MCESCSSTLSTQMFTGQGTGCGAMDCHRVEMLDLRFKNLH